MKRFDIVTIFPEILESYFNESLFKRAQKNKLFAVKTHNLRRWTTDRHQTVDAKPYGGGAGLLFKIEPIYKALKAITKKQDTIIKKNNSNKKLQATSYKLKTRIILTAANGKRFTQKDAARLAKYEQLVFVCPRYEGVDARVEKLVDEKISIGDYVLAGGELPAAVIIEAVCRQLPGFVGKQESVEKESHATVGYLEHPHYTRPEVFTVNGKKLRVPKVLLSGHHGAVEKWRQKKSKKQ
ncbi:MAG: tRNA (guanosine(37)-N1)-methyltransferase TrmD [Patescibacteria group bacterium]|jgi:tRNA (guanine37-N1)-methyltransferase